MTEPDLAKAAEHYKNFCEALGIDLERPDTIDTPMRVARMLSEEFTCGLRKEDFKFTVFPAEGANQLVVLCGMRIVSMCAHHHLPFFGVCHVCYLPGAYLAGLSKIPRLVQHVARQPTMQEHVVRAIGAALKERLSPRFLGVSIVAEHTCMSCRGAKDYESRTSTTEFWYDGKDNAFEDTRNEFFRSISEWYATRSAGR